MALATRLRAWFGRKQSPVALSLEVAGITEVGCVRDHNEDALYLPAKYVDLGEKPFLLVVADGMGGQASGEIASSAAIEVLAAHAFDGQALAESIKAVMLRANEEIQAQAKEDPDLENMGTTCTALAFRGNDLVIGHIGDTRAYLIRNGDMRQLTIDHTFVAQLIASRVLTPEQARVHPQRSVLMRALGTKPEVEIDVSEEPIRLKPGDRLAVCSDGLHDLVEDAEIKDNCERLNPEDACKSLIELALSRGGYDNITIVVALVHKREAPSIVTATDTEGSAA